MLIYYIINAYYELNLCLFKFIISYIIYYLYYYIDSPDWIKYKIATKNPINKKGKCFQYATTLALDQEKMGKHPERIKKN